MDDFFGVPPSILIISSVEPNLSSYCTIIGCEGGQTSRKSWILSLVMTNSTCLTHQFMWFSSTLALEKNSLMISNSTRVQEFCACLVLEHVRYESVLKWFHLYDPFHDDCFILITVIILHISFSRLEMIKISAHLEVGFLVVACLVGAIYAKEHKIEKKQVCKHKTEHKT